MSLELIKDYRDNVMYRRSYKKLAGNVFGIDFERWYRLGFWDDRYKCYSFVDGSEVVSNVSVSMVDLILDGSRIHAVQIGTVMTHSDYKKMGLAEKLMNEVLKDYKERCDLIFLFSNFQAEGFYRRFPFYTVNETCFYTQLSDIDTVWPDVAGHQLHGTTRRLNMSDTQDIEIIRRLTSHRIPLSSSFGVDHAEGITAWHCLNVFPEDTYYIEDLETIVIYKAGGKTLELFDIVCTDKPDYLKIIGALELGCVEEIVFRFTPDCSSFLPIKTRPYTAEDYIFFVMSESVRFPGEFFYPDTAHA